MKIFRIEYKDFLVKTMTQLKSSLPLLIVPYFFLLGTLIAAWVISERYNILIDNLFREPAAILGFNPFLGVMSNFGVLLWAFSVAICFFVAILFMKRDSKEIGLFLLCSSMITLMLLVDDFCLLHERVFPRYLHIPEMVVYLAYILAMLLYFLRFAKVILNTDYSILLLACAFLALSIGSDLILPQTGIAVLIEDGLKLFGIATWLIYFSRTSYLQTLKLLK